MTACTNCQAELRPQWKFCIRCGAAAARVEIPSAIRPEHNDRPSRRRVDIPLLVGIALGIAGVALIVYLVIVLGGTT